MASTVVGSVTAELILDTNKFVPALKEASELVKGLGTIGNIGKTSEQISQLEQRVVNLSNTIQSQAEKIEKLETQLKKLDETYNLTGESVNKLGAEIKNTNESIQLDFSKLAEEMSKLKEQERLLDEENKRLSAGLASVGEGLKLLETVAGSSTERLIASIQQSNASFRELQAEIMNLAGGLSGYNGEIAKTVSSEFELTGAITSVVEMFSRFNAELAKENGEFNVTNEQLTKTGEAFNLMGMNLAKSGEQIAMFEKNLIKIKEALSMGREFTLFEGILANSEKATASTSKVYQEVEKLRTSLNNLGSNPIRLDLSQLETAGTALIRFEEQINIAQQSLKRFGTVSPNLDSFKANLSSVYELMAKFGTIYEQGDYGSRRWSESIRSASVTLQDYYKNVEMAQTATQNYINSQQQFGSVINNASGQIAREKAELQQLANAENQASMSATKLSSATRQASSGMSTLTGATTKLQGALSSLKMVATALSSMFIWTFGMSLYEATKQTLESKNEMESYLTQMGLGRGAINLFNQGLDETAERFKKLNKYMIGETIAGIGMEFDLTANQMKESMEVVAMIQNEYVRAGRKESEATLAVKDILQGEFLRLSRETGVGKQDLIDTGLWSGDIKDVVGIMEALKKVGTDRHWDLFAEKCISLNDVISETRNRISEFGAMLGDQLSPAIVAGFNMLIEIIDKVTTTWDNFNPTEKIVVGSSAILAFGTALMMVVGNLTLADIATMGYTNSLLTTVLRLDVATVKEYGLSTAIMSRVTSLEASTVAEMGGARAILARLVGLDATIVKEGGLRGAIIASAVAKQADTVSTEANTFAKSTNLTTTEGATVVTGAYSTAKDLETMALAENTSVAEMDSIMHEALTLAEIEESVATDANTVMTEANTLAKMANEEMSIGLLQALAMQVAGVDALTASEMSATEATWALITSLTAIEAIAIIAVLAVVATALGSLAMEAQRAKEAVDGFYDIVDNGSDYLESAQKDVENLRTEYENLNNAIAQAQAEGRDTWQLEQNKKVLEKDLEIAQKNVEDIQNCNEQAVRSSEDFQKQISRGNLDFQRRNAQIFESLGKETNEARLEATQYCQQYLRGMDQMRIATNAYNHALEGGANHMENNVEALRKAGAENEQLIQYTKDYGEEVLRNAEYQKEWAEGDFWAIFKIGLSDLKLAWIDFTYWVSTQDWYNDLLNALGELQNALGEVWNAIKPVIPILWEVAKWVGMRILENIVFNAQMIYLIIKALYPVAREIAGHIYNGAVAIAGACEDTYNILKKIYDFVSGNEGKSITEFFSNLGFKHSDEYNNDPLLFMQDYTFSVMEATAQLTKFLSVAGMVEWALGDVGIDVKDFGKRWLDAVIQSFSFGQLDFSSINNIIPLDELFDAMIDYGAFGVGEYLAEKLRGFLKDAVFKLFENPEEFTQGLAIDYSSFFTNIFTNLGTQVQPYIQQVVQLMYQGFITALANTPLIGDILNWLGIIDSGEVQSSANDKGASVGYAFGIGLEQVIGAIPVVGDILRILGYIDSTNPTANNKGNAVGTNIHDGVQNGISGTASLVSAEMNEVINAVANKAGQAYSVAQRVGSSILNGINSIIQHHSPGVPALLIADEMTEIINSMSDAEDDIYLQAQDIGYAITSGIQPNVDISFDAEAMAQYQANTMMAMGMAGETVDTTESAFSQLDLDTTLTFANIGTTIGTTMSNIANTTRLNYTTVANTTKTQLANMQSQTTKNIGAIKQSWTGMQTALIASAEHIRSETGAKINSLQNNMASFWRKVQNPALLLGAGNQSEDKGVRKHRFSSHGRPVSNLLKGHYAGSNVPSPKNSSRRLFNFDSSKMGTGLLGQYKDSLMNWFSEHKTSMRGINVLDALAQYLQCLVNGGNCVAGHYAGGWDFNWSDDIKQALLKWHTHFGEIYDPYLYVGKFENDNFPVRGIAPIAKRYIYDAISRTSYEYYFDQKYASPLDAWNAGHFNCYDGALLVLALANAFGFSGYMKHGTWSGIGHVWAYVNGIGDIDATAIQGGYGFTSPKVAGHPREMFPHKPKEEKGKGDTILNINVDLSGANITDDNIGVRIGKQVRDEIIDLINPNPSTGA